MAIGREFIELMDKIGYSFHDLSYIERALTHSSYSNEMKNLGIRAESNETLEFLGDAVLQLCISEKLYENYSKKGEGTLTVLRKNIVCEDSLASIARKLDIGLYLNIGTGDEQSSVRYSSKVLADALEALIAAIYLDDMSYGGTKYREIIVSLFKDTFNESYGKDHTDYKTALQQFVEKNEDTELRYEVVEESGPDHNKTFTIIALINNNVVGRGIGKTKKIAEMHAAKEALALFGVK